MNYKAWHTITDGNQAIDLEMDYFQDDDGSIGMFHVRVDTDTVADVSLNREQATELLNFLKERIDW